MFDPDSRYHDLPTRTYHRDDGREVIFKARRLLRQGPTGAALFWEEVAPADRPDLVAQRTLSDPLRFWRLCEANGASDPFELTQGGRKRVRIPQPGE